MSEHFEMSVWQELNRIANALEKIVELNTPQTFTIDEMSEEELDRFKMQWKEPQTVLLKGETPQGEK